MRGASRGVRSRVGRGVRILPAESEPSSEYTSVSSTKDEMPNSSHVASQLRSPMSSMITASIKFSTEIDLFRRCQNLVQRNRGDCFGVVGHLVGNDQLPAVQQTAAGVNHVWDVAFALVFDRL